MLIYDPDKRPTAKQCLNHECFKDLVEQDQKMTKMSQINFYQNSILMKSFNDISLIKNDDSLQIININNNNNQNNNCKTLKPKKKEVILIWDSKMQIII